MDQKDISKLLSLLASLRVCSVDYVFFIAKDAKRFQTNKNIADVRYEFANRVRIFEGHVKTFESLLKHMPSDAVNWRFLSTVKESVLHLAEDWHRIDVQAKEYKFLGNEIAVRERVGAVMQECVALVH
ncbi:hypothetical protein HZA98_01015 [Candidatus Woesearchaeota archaeon]|nr:hypothetical protein [Candidatus Woesearchaeota archaeon]